MVRPRTSLEIFSFAKDHYTVPIRPIPFVGSTAEMIFSMNHLISSAMNKRYKEPLVQRLCSLGCIHTLPNIPFWSLYPTELRTVSLRGEGYPKLQHWQLGNEPQKYFRHSLAILTLGELIDQTVSTKCGQYFLLVGLLGQHWFTSSPVMTCLDVLAEVRLDSESA